MAGAGSSAGRDARAGLERERSPPALGAGGHQKRVPRSPGRGRCWELEMREAGRRPDAKSAHWRVRRRSFATASNLVRGERDAAVASTKRRWYAERRGLGCAVAPDPPTVGGAVVAADAVAVAEAGAGAGAVVRTALDVVAPPPPRIARTAAVAAAEGVVVGGAEDAEHAIKKRIIEKEAVLSLLELTYGFWGLCGAGSST